MERRASTCCDPRRTVSVKVVTRASCGVATGTSLSTGPMPSMLAPSPLNTAVSWVLSPTWTALAADVKLSITGGAGGGPESPGDEDPQPAARSEHKASAPPRHRSLEVGSMIFRPPTIGRHARMRLRRNIRYPIPAPATTRRTRGSTCPTRTWGAADRGHQISVITAAHAPAADPSAAPVSGGWRGAIRRLARYRARKGQGAVAEVSVRQRHPTRTNG